MSAGSVGSAGTGRPTGRVATQQAAAESLGVNRRSLNNWEKEPWWEPEFRTADGYDVTAILRKRTSLAMPSTDMGDTRTRLKIATEKVVYDIKQAELRERLREEQQAIGNVLPLDVWEEFAREFLGLVRQSLEQLPAQMRKEAGPDQLRLVWTEEGDSPLQRRLAKIVSDVESWLSEGPDGAA